MLNALLLLGTAGAITLGIVLSIVILAFLTGAARYIPNHRVGIVEKLWSTSGSVESGFIALDGEAGFQPGILRGGWHFFTPLMYRIHSMPLVTIPQGKIGYVYARDGAPLPSTQALASNAVADSFEDVSAFLKAGGQRGPQRKLLRDGTFGINLAQFAVLTDDRAYFLPLERGDTERFERMSDLIRERKGFRPVCIQGGEDLVGVVTVHDGPSMPDGEIIAPTVGTEASDPGAWHDNFQDSEAFLRAGGRRGRQLQVVTEGTWYINRLFATVELIPKTIIEVGHAGVVVNYTGERGSDLSGDAYSHGELVEPGHRGVCHVPLLPGKYAFNTFAGKVIPVPTTNIILKWIRNQRGSHGYDENLSEVSLITKDAFEPSLPLSVVVHIDYRKAPLVIQRFGDIQRLVEQTLDPMVAAYFKNIGQTRTLIQLLQDRAAIQDQASREMREKFEHYNLELEEVLIGTPTGSQGDHEIEQILTQLRARQVAEEQVETYQRQEQAAFHERSLREAESRAKQQARITESELAIVVQTNEGKAKYQRSVQEAAQVRVLAEAEAEKAARIGIAQAMATEEQVRAYGGPQFQVVSSTMERFAQAVERSHIDMVPKIVVGGTDGKSGNLMDAILALVLSDKLGALASPGSAARSPEAEAIRSELSARLVQKRPTPHADAK
jgi:uncharacterized membrane protein YqiK